MIINAWKTLHFFILFISFIFFGAKNLELKYVFVLKWQNEITKLILKKQFIFDANKILLE